MSTIKVSDSQGNVHQVPFASTLKELPYSQKIDFDVAVEDIALWAQACDDGGDGVDAIIEQQGYYCYLLARAVSAYTGYDFSQVIKFNVADLVDSHGDLLPHVVDKHLQKDYEVDYDSAENTLYTIYRAAKGVIDGYTFSFRNTEDCLIKHAGKWWMVPHVVQNLFDGRKVFSRFDTAQAVESLMIRNYLDEKVNRVPRKNLPAEQVANKRFSAHLNLIAISLAPATKQSEQWESEPLPLDAKAFSVEVANRVPLFQDIDTKSAMDVIFFLTATTKNSKVIQQITTILMSPSPSSPTTS